MKNAIVAVCILIGLLFLFAFVAYFPSLVSQPKLDGKMKFLPAPNGKTNMQTGTAEVNGTKLYYEIAGAGQPLVLVNGSSLDLTMWDEQAETLAANFRVIRYDLRGIGKSAEPDRNFSHSEDLYQLLKFLGIEKTIVLGLSFGGAIALDFALEHPEMLDALILAASALSSLKDEYSEGLAALAKITKESGAEAAIKTLMEIPTFVAPENAAARRKTHEILLANRRIFETDFPLIRFWQPPPISPADVSKINAPVLIITGDRDAPEIHQIADDLERNIKGAKRISISGAAHMVNLERPAEFNRAVLDFLQTQPVQFDKATEN